MKMANVIWKSFKLGELFQRKTPPNTGKPAKELTIYDENDGSRIALVTRGERNNGVVGYIEKNSFLSAKNKIIYNDQFGTILFHNYEFTTIKDHLSVLEPVDRLLSILEQNIHAYIFITKLINKIFNKQIFGFSYSAADFKFPREILLLPTLEVKDEKDCIWEKNGKYWTLAVDYISVLMTKAKERKEEKTIKLYAAEKKKYEAEKKKYEAKYILEKRTLIWKAYRLGELFDWSKRKDLSLKNYNSIEHYEVGYVEAVTGSKTNNNKYYSKSELPENYPTYSNCLSLNTNGSIGYCFYNEHDIISPTSSVHILLHKNSKFEALMTDTSNQFLSKIITQTFVKQPFGYTYLIDKDKFDREFIILPVLEVSKNEDHIWEENSKHWMLALNTVSYLYLQGQCNILQNKINNYSYGY
jgi:hypothetical protein